MYIVMDELRHRDILAQDTTAPTLAQARAAAEALAARFGTRVRVLAVVGEVEGAIEPRWTQPLPDNSPTAFGGWILSGPPCN